VEAATLQEGASAPAPRAPYREHTRRFGRNSKNLTRERRKFTGELPEDQRWIQGLEGKYAINVMGNVISYANGYPYTLTTRIHNGSQCVQIFDGVDTRRYWIALELAKSFLGSDKYAFIDGNKLNAVLENIMLVSDLKPSNETWIEGFEGMYSINDKGDFHSYKRHQRKLMKVSRCGRVNLSNNGVQRLFNVNKLFRKMKDISLMN
jgi:hypothetical protein